MKKPANKKIKLLTKEPIGKVKIIPDFLPNPADLILKEETVKITLAMTKQSLAFFKKTAKLQAIPYQKIIRALLDQYACYHKR